MKRTACSQIKSRLSRSETSDDGDVRIDIGNGVVIVSSVTDEAIDDLSPAMGGKAVTSGVIGGRISMRALCFAVAVAFAVGATAVAPAEGPSGIMVAGPGHAPASFGAGDLAGLASVQVKTEFLTDRGTRLASFEGPLLWAVLEKAGAIDPVKHREQVSQTVVITGRDGYRAVLALGEIAPEFEAKQVILAERMDGKPLDPDHFRVVVPLDKRGGRSVRDVVRIEVSAAAPSQ
ncbi:MAG: molybdopterin-dependent oxidoreductase [Alphaproteobacteria bacterium]|nr:molybdopterin-dependent oxidoreductase [Alphaproteobacteria bacterium]